MSKPSIPIKITCPECQGCINLEVEEHSNLCMYRCQVGHTYSLQEIIKGKEVQVENHFWTIIGLLEHLETLYEQLLQERLEAQTLSASDRQNIHDRLACVARHKQIVLTLTEENTPPPLNDGDE